MKQFIKIKHNRKYIPVMLYLLMTTYAMLIILNLISCKKNDDIDPDDLILKLNRPQGAPNPVFSIDNQPTRNRLILGKKLFHDPILSRDSTVSCASCHLQNLYFQDNRALSAGIEGRQTLRNAPSLLNIAYHPYFFWDGGNPTLELQVLGPIDNHNEFDFDIVKIIEKLNKSPEYIKLFRKAYGQDPSVYAMTRAIACYERTLFTGNSRHDDYLYNDNLSALNASEIRGMNIFFGEKGECFHCHSGYNFTDYSFKNNGLYLVYADSGRARITTLHSDVGKFKVPSLRNVAMTAPYMHDGSIATLEEVVAHYNSGGKPHPNKSGLLVPLHLTVQEQADLVAFLKCLTGEIVLND